MVCLLKLFPSPPTGLASAQMLRRKKKKTVLKLDWGDLINDICSKFLPMKKTIPMPTSQYAQDSHFEVVPPGEVDDKVGGGVEDEGEVVEAGQAEDPWLDLA